MLRKLFLLAVVAIVAGLAVFWFITRPVIVTAAALPAYTPDVARGQAVFNAGQCIGTNTSSL